MQGKFWFRRWVPYERRRLMGGARSLETMLTERLQRQPGKGSTKTMRITFVTTNINLRDGGGSSLSFHLAASELIRRGHCVRVLTLGSSGEQLPDDLPYEVIDLGWNGVKRLAQMQVTRDAMRNHAGRTDVYHIYDAQLALGAGAYRAEGGSVPIVVNLNKYRLFCTNQDRMDGHCHRDCSVAKRVQHAPVSARSKMRSIPLRLYEQWRGFDYVNRIDRFLAVSPAIVQIYAEAGFDTSRNTIVPSSIDYNLIRSRIDSIRSPVSGEPSANPGKERPWQILFVGRLVPAKGADVVLDALPQINDPVHLHIAGDGPQRGVLEDRAVELGVADRVTFHGWVPNDQIWDLYQHVQLFIHAGRWPEPSGRTVLEAMAAGVPVIVSDVGGAPWQLNGYGRTFTPGDSSNLADRIDTALHDYPGSQRLAQQAQDHAAEFDHQRVVSTLEKAYRLVQARASGSTTAVSSRLSG